MKKEYNLLVLGMFPWSYSQLSDTIRSMIKASNHLNVVYINPQAEIRSLSLNWEIRKENNMEIWNPPFSFLPTRYGIHRLREKLTAQSLITCTEKALGKNWRDHTVMYVTPTTLEQSYEYVKALKPKKLVLDILDDNLNFPSISASKKEKLTNMFKDLCQHATTITAVSQYLVEQTKNLTNKSPIYYLPNGVDVVKFQKKEENPPSDLANIPHPRITFVGALTTWIDFKLIQKTATSLMDHHFVLIGPIDPSVADNPALKSLQSMENVHFLGAKPYDQVPNYLHHSDVLLLPRTMDPYSLACDPLKLYEYLATGKPVVSTDHPSIQRFLSFVEKGENADQITKGIIESLNRSEEKRKLQLDSVDSLSWETRLNRLLELINQP
jgi:glycosyltransferase involved in cell wall biosynthesis